MTIRHYSPIVPWIQIDDPTEYEGNLLALLRDQEQGYTLEEKRRDFQVVVNGKVIPFAKYGDTELAYDDDVAIYYSPKGGFIKSIGNLISGIFKVVFGIFGVSMGGTGASRRYGGPGSGERLEAASIRSNTPRMGATVPEMFGRTRRFCDSLNEQRRFYVNRRDQYVDALLHVTIGELSNPIGYLGTNPLSDMPGCQYWIHPPGASLAGHEPAQLWHSSPAVGGTAGGTAGIMLSADIESTVNTDPPAYTLSGNTISRSQGLFPTGWGPGTKIRIDIVRTKTYDATRTNNPFPEPNWNTFIGDFSHLMPLSNGGQVTFIAGPVIGDYLTQAVNVDAQGYGSLQLWTLPGPPSTDWPDGMPSFPVNNVPVGRHSMTSEVVVEKTLINNFDTQIIYEGQALPSETGPATIRYVSGPIYGPYTAPIIVSPTGQKNREVEVDMFLPQGLRYTEDDGSPSNTSVTVDIEFSDADGVVPTHVMRRVYTDKTPDQLGFTEKYTYPSPARIRVRVRRIGAVSADPRRVDEVHWYGLRCRMPDKNSYPWTTMTVRLKAGNQLGTQSENQVNVIGTRILPELQSNGTLSPPTPTRDIAAAALRVARMGGYELQDWDDEIAHLNQTYWKPRGETFDFVLDETTIKGALDMILAAGFSELTTEHGYLKPVRDIPRTTFDQGFSAQNTMTEIVQTTRHHRHDDNDGYEVEYIDQDTWETMTVKCMPPGSLGVRLRSLKLDGVSKRHIAWRIGMRRAMSDLYRRTGFSIRTEAAGLNAYYLSHIAIINTLRNWGQSFNLLRVEQAGDRALLFLSERVVFADIEPPYVAAVTDAQGRVIGPFPATMIDDECIEITGVTTALPVPSFDRQLPTVYFGEQGKMSYAGLVQSVQPEQGMFAKIEAINYDDRVYTYDDQFPTE